MANFSTLPSPYDLTHNILFYYFGVPGLITLFAAYVYINWAKILKWPGVMRVVTYILQKPIPTADPSRFSVLIAHLYNDESREYEQLIVEALNEFKGIQVLRLDRTISLEASVPEEIEKLGHERGLQYLDKSGASVLIWGKILRRGDNTVPKLYWTTNQACELKSKRYDAFADSQLSLPEIFWSDLADILNLLVTSHAYELSAKEDGFIADRLPLFIKKIRTLLEASDNLQSFTSETVGEICIILADALRKLGEQSGKTEPLQESITFYRKALEKYPREQRPLEWANSQHLLGIALRSLGKRETGTARLEEALTAIRESLKERTRERVPLKWANSQNSLGVTLGSLAERVGETARLEEAVSAYREALEESTRELVPLQWATIQNNLGCALGALSDMDSGTARVEEAVKAFREALNECTQKHAPLDWAETQNNLGTALGLLGRRENNKTLIEEAIAVLQQVLKVNKRNELPLKWASTQNSLGIVFCCLGNMEGEMTLNEEGIGAFRKALNENTRELVPLEWAKTQYNLGNALRSLGEIECMTAILNETHCEWGCGTARLEEAVSTYQEAIQEVTSEQWPINRENIQKEIDETLQLLDAFRLQLAQYTSSI